MSEIKGLSDERAEALRGEGLCNKPPRSMTRSYKRILFDNIFSVFNLVNAVIAAALIYVGSYKNCLFMLAVLLNTAVGIIQEVRSKRTIDKLSILSRTSVTLIRSGKRRGADVSELVLGDVIELETGSQVPNDCVVLSGCCEVNESLLTGESEPVFKNTGDKLLSGSFVVSGTAVCEITAVGSDNYADSVLQKIKYVKAHGSEMLRVINRIMTVLGACIFPIGALLFYSRLSQPDTSFRGAVEGTAAALIGMIPQGLVLLTSTVFVLGIVRLSKKNVLSRELYSLESSARADVLCIDKTGTITTGEMTVEKLVPAHGFDIDRLSVLLSAYAANSPDKNGTISAIRDKYNENVGEFGRAVSVCPFSSSRKWASVTLKEQTVIIGSPETIFGDSLDLSALDRDDTSRYRVVAVAVSKNEPRERTLPDDISLVGFILLSEKIRDGIKDAFSYFESQHVEIKVISGDAPATVSRLCRGVMGEGLKCADLSGMNDEETAAAAEEYRIFGRATPHQKWVIINALRKNGHKTAMVGDGVNDVLALKESDCSVAPASGSGAARNVSQLVLLDSDFSSLPSVVSEGRRCVNNLQSSSALFLTKTIFSLVMAVIFIFIDDPYPFEPIQMTLISALTIGFPSFVLSLRRNDTPISGSFVSHILKNALPAALTNVILSVAIVIMSTRYSFSDDGVAALCTLAFAVTGMLLIWKIYRPLDIYSFAVFIVCMGGFALAFSFFPKFFGLLPPCGEIFPFMAIVSISDAVIMLTLLKLLSFIKD